MQPDFLTTRLLLLPLVALVLRAAFTTKPKSSPRASRFPVACVLVLVALLALGTLWIEHQSLSKQQRELASTVDDIVTRFEAGYQRAPSVCESRVGFGELVKRRISRDRRDILVTLTDKAASKRFGELNGVKSPAVLELLAAGQCELLRGDSEWLRRGNFVLKATHMSGCVVVVEGGVVRNTPAARGACALEIGTTVGLAELKQYCNAVLNFTPNMREETAARALAMWGIEGVLSHREWAYGLVQPRMMVEAQVPQHASCDYKCFTFWGRTHSIMQVCNRFEPLLKTDTFFKRNGQAMNATLINMRGDGAATLSARVTHQVVTACDTLSRGLDQARVDVYYDSKEDVVYLGEMTMYHMGGRGRYEPPSLDMALGDQWCPTV